MAQASTHGARKLAWRTQARMAHASRLGQKTEKKEEEEWEKERERLNDGNNNGQGTHGAGKHAWRTQAAWANLFKPYLYGDIHLMAIFGVDYMFPGVGQTIYNPHCP